MIYEYIQLFWYGISMTLFIAFWSACISLMIGCILGIAGSSRITNTRIAQIVDCYIFIVRAIPVYIQVLIAYFVVPALLSISCSAIGAAICAIGICSSAYTATIVRGGIAAIAPGQWEAAQTIGLSTLQTIYYVVIPQTIRIIFPMLINELESIIKSTSIVSTIGVVELSRTGAIIIARYFNPVPIYIIVALLYVLLSAAINLFMRLIKQRWIYGA